MAYPSRGAEETAPKVASRSVRRAKKRSANPLKIAYDAAVDPKARATALKALTAAWDDILKSEGFDDIELGANALGERDSPYLKRQHPGQPSHRTARLERLEQWWLAAKVHDNHSPLERDTVILTIKGHGTERIAELVGLSRDAIRSVLAGLDSKAARFANTQTRAIAQERAQGALALATDPMVELGQQVLTEFQEQAALNTPGWVKPPIALDDLGGNLRATLPKPKDPK